MENLDIILISSVLPEPTMAGQVVLYRHLANRSYINLKVYGNAIAPKSINRIENNILACLRKMGMNKLVNDYVVIRNARWLDRLLPSKPALTKNTLVLSVAFGEACFAAQRYANKMHLPLVTCFDDYYPDIPNIHDNVKNILEKRFISLFWNSTLRISVSPGMIKYFGSPERAYSVYPMPGKPKVTEYLHGNKYKLLYSGNLYDYGEMVLEVAEQLANNDNIIFEIRGGNPIWDEATREKLKKKKQWLGFAEKEEYEKWLCSADAFLCLMRFDEKYKRRMKTSFLTKLTEYAQYGKPIIIWGPPYCSAVEWAMEGDKALVVSDPDVKMLIKKVEELRLNPVMQKYYGDKAKKSAEDEFNPEKIHGLFMSHIYEAINI